MDEWRVWFFPIFYSVAGGAIVYFLQFIWTNLVVNKMFSVQGNEPKIDGRWKTFYAKYGIEYNEYIYLRQRGRKIIRYNRFS